VRERNIYAVLLDGRVPLPKLRSPIDAGARLVLPLGSTRLLLERRRLLRVDSRMERLVYRFRALILRPRSNFPLGHVCGPIFSQEPNTDRAPDFPLDTSAKRVAIRRSPACTVDTSETATCLSHFSASPDAPSTNRGSAERKRSAVDRAFERSC
jgi:hypothetical protein